ncbi:DUF805 domain-containing protein [Stenotrophomonas maltophilia]|uniref:DUF805 domain-containing protein n=1 Tax=Stenotrophomonas maltophilia TaxID=40324 RepID=A0AA41CGZ5_STEMA|nr:MULTISPECIES: DUF805 domain-containing protein [Stenotrophomonas]AWB77040.1 DUF805 domain-containing protein [Stenotrophomonas maltophilia]KOO84910.1 membrane protein [Stenotrophomonas maltophilia]MBH1586539.1 DUF805 domain-containing protein [Stenotrophomonas maltophilia]MBH1718622.1 DUF805 domain-containing protein [Stenotrophomonas maltophilia]MBH1791095.1 DUF805 domain-containing protein [Stenotrophomonas maltophilia]
MHKMMIPLVRYAQFSGRASRSEFWWFQLFVVIVLIPSNVLGFIAGYTGSSTLALISTGVGALVWLAIIVPLIAVTVRRLHDTDRSGWWYLLMLVPIVGLVVLVFLLLPGTPGNNRFDAAVPHV